MDDLGYKYSAGLELQELADVSKKEKSGTTVGIREIMLNLLSSILLFVLAALANGFNDGKFEYEQIFTWNMGVLTLLNWACGIGITYSMRQVGLRLGMETMEYKKAESDKHDAFNNIVDYSSAQRELDKKIDIDFENRRTVLENNISKLVKHKMPIDNETSLPSEWKLGMPLPAKTRLKVRLMAKALAGMTPPIISLIELAEDSASKMPKSLFDIPDDPTTTGVKWFTKKGVSKLFFFGITPVILSIIAGGLSGGAAFKSFFLIAGTLSIMLFNAIVSFTTSRYTVVQKGIARLKRITRIIKIVI